MGSQEEVRFGSPELEGMVVRPTAETDRKVCVILTHPHSKLGGSMYNNVTLSVSKLLVDNGMTVLLFNFRGVGKSKGSSTWTGKAERADFESSVRFARAMQGVEKVFGCGYSFGSAIGAGCSDMLDGFVAISYPYGRMAGCALGSHYPKANTGVPKLFIVGSHDQFASSSQLSSFVQGLKPPRQFVLVDDADHFWQGCERRLHKPILDFFLSLL